MLPKFVADKLEQELTPHAVPPTPGVNAPVTPPDLDPNPLPSGHWLDDVATGRGDLITAMTDPDAMKDRRMAEKELAGKFQIVDPKMKGPRLPNQVTAAELHQLANTYSDIRLGRGDLTIDSSASPQYAADMMDDIGDIMQTSSGRALIAGLSNATNKDKDGNVVHRHTTLGAALNPDTGAPDSNFTQESAVGGDAFGTGHVGLDGKTGVGVDTRVAANPNMDLPNSTGTGNTRSDVALYHELVHAYHDTRGTMANDLVQPDESWLSAAPLGAYHPRDPNVEADAAANVHRDEYQAAGLGLYSQDFLTENTYRRERTQVAKSGKGLPGDRLMPQRTSYAHDDTDYKTMLGQ